MPDLSSWNVLIVDDEPDNIGLIQLVLEFHNAQVTSATSGEECLTMLQTSTPSVILLDIQMPEMSGFDVLRVLREHAHWKRIPVVAVTAHAMVGDEERILAAGFDGYIPKPINAMTFAEEFTAIIGTKVNGHRE